jgi:very-short-patch-repair endonuclease
VPQEPAIATRSRLSASSLGVFHAIEARGRRYRYDFAFPAERVILETNGRRWHDDAADFEHDQEQWSVPARHGFRIVFAPWDRITRHPDEVVEEFRRSLRCAS